MHQNEESSIPPSTFHSEGAAALYARYALSFQEELLFVKVLRDFSKRECKNRQFHLSHRHNKKTQCLLFLCTSDSLEEIPPGPQPAHSPVQEAPENITLSSDLSPVSLTVE